MYGPTYFYGLVQKGYRGHPMELEADLHAALGDRTVQRKQ